MNHARLTVSFRDWVSAWIACWDQFWFTPRLPHALAVLRVVTGLMLLYSHLVLATDLLSFTGQHAWINDVTVRQLHDGTFGFVDGGRTYLWHLHDARILWAHHLLTMIVTACFAAGLMTRITAPAAWFLQLMYLHRMTGTLFGLDQIVTYCAMYLMLAPCGSWLSVDSWLRRRFADRRSRSRFWQWMWPEATESVSANIATRMLQLHLCVIYLFGGLAKARGQLWWDGTAIWYSVSNYEYQSLDMTWLSRYPRVFSTLTHVTLFWEIFYCALVWPRLTRPLVLAVAVAVHGGIALAMGMITFGWMMIAANMVFLDPGWVMRLRGAKTDSPEQAPPTVTAADRPSGAGAAAGSLAEREHAVDEAERRLREARETLSRDKEKHRDRVKRLQDREAKLKRTVERRKHRGTTDDRPPRD